MQNKTNKLEKTISLPNLPNIIIAVVLIVGIGAVYGLMGYLFFGIKENVTPVIQESTQKPSMEIADNYFGNEFIQVKSPQKNAVVKSPILISGKANVNEANVRVRISDDNKNILADDFITADGWMDKLYSFEKEIDYKTPQTKNGLIEIFEESAKDGSDLYKVEVLVVFEEYGDEISDWQIYWNEEYGFKFEYPKETKNLSSICEIRVSELRNSVIRLCECCERKSVLCHDLKIFKKLEDESIRDAIERVGIKEDGGTKCLIKELDLYNEKSNFKSYQITEITGQPEYKKDNPCSRYLGNIFTVDTANPEIFFLFPKVQDSFIDHYLEWIKSVEFVDQCPECSIKNPPKIYYGKGTKSLNLCGEKTGFPVYEFKEEEFILFTDRKFGDYESKTCSLKTISTKYPFEEKILSEKIENRGSFYLETLFKEEDLYFLGSFGDGPGSLASIFIFEPKSKDFIYFFREAMMDIDIKIVSSKSSVPFNAEKKARRLLGEKVDSLSDDDIEIIINNEELSKKDVNKGHSMENQEAVFNCYPPGFMMIDSNYYDHPDHYPDNHGERINRTKINIRRYAEYFPNKFPCFVNEESDEITGYFDLIENKFVPVSNL